MSFWTCYNGTLRYNFVSCYSVKKEGSSSSDRKEIYSSSCRNNRFVSSGNAFVHPSFNGFEFVGDANCFRRCSPQVLPAPSIPTGTAVQTVRERWTGSSWFRAPMLLILSELLTQNNQNTEARRTQRHGEHRVLRRTRSFAENTEFCYPGPLCASVFQIFRTLMDQPLSLLSPTTSNRQWQTIQQWFRIAGDWNHDGLPAQNCVGIAAQFSSQNRKLLAGKHHDERWDVEEVDRIVLVDIRFGFVIFGQ